MQSKDLHGYVATGPHAYAAGAIRQHESGQEREVTTLEGIAQRIHGLRDRAGNLGVAIQSMADRNVGPEEIGDKLAGAHPVRCGWVGELDAALNSLESSLDMASYQFGRIERL